MKNILCQKCRENPATFYYKETRNGKTEEYHLCAHCAEEMGFSKPEDLFSAFPLFTAFPTYALDREKTCPVCHTPLSAIRESGSFGCSSCYDVFSSLLDMTPFVGSGFSGRRLARGKAKESAAEKKEKKKETLSPLEQMKKDLREAVEKEEYEKAAKLRDKIRREEAK